MPEIPGRLRPPRIASAPATPAAGETYYDTGSNRLFFWNGTMWIGGAGGDSELGYDQITATVSVVGTTSAAPTTVIAGAAHSFDGGPVMLEFFSSLVRTPSVLASRIFIALSESAAVVAQLGSAKPVAAANQDLPWLSRFRFTPSAGSHTYSIVSWVDATTGAPFVGAGTGTAGGFVPTYMRFTKV